VLSFLVAFNPVIQTRVFFTYCDCTSQTAQQLWSFGKKIFLFNGTVLTMIFLNEKKSTKRIFPLKMQLQVPFLQLWFEHDVKKRFSFAAAVQLLQGAVFWFPSLHDLPFWHTIQKLS